MPALEESLFPRPPSWRGSYTDRTGLAARNRGLRRLTSGGARREGLMAPEGISRPEPRGDMTSVMRGYRVSMGPRRGRLQTGVRAGQRACWKRLATVQAGPPRSGSGVMSPQASEERS